MSENITTPTEPVANASVSVPAEAPVTEGAPAPSAPVEKLAEPTPELPVNPVVSDAKEPESLIGAEDVKDPEEKVSDPADKPVEADENKNESQSDEPAPLPSYEKFTLPEGVPLDDEALNLFVENLGNFELETKVSHEAVQKFGQKLVDMYIDRIQKTFERAQAAQTEAFLKLREGWVQETKNDPEIGGNRFETVTKACRRLISDHGGTSDQQAEVRNILNQTGIGDHPAMIRFLSNLATYVREPVPLPATKPVPQKLTAAQKLYGGQ